ncbi:MAG TPA: bifunctional nuclease family protein [Phycisphaerae bacterium]|nr:bifunctional nuclease family protein [Phycisphaerae bacterium]
MAVQVELKRIIITEASDQQVIYLKELGGERAFPIVIGTPEALAIDRRLKGQPTPRPQTHELLSSVIEKLDGQLERIVINDLQDHTFFARLVIRQNGKTVEIDSRPSDAIALGVSNNVPIFVAEHVLDEVGG